MNDIWVRYNFKDVERLTREIEKRQKEKQPLEEIAFTAYLDAIRLCRKDCPNAHPVLEGRRSAYTAKIPRSYAAQTSFAKHDFEYMNRPSVAPAPAKLPEASFRPEIGSNEPTPPVVVPLGQMILAGCTDKSKLRETLDSVRLTCISALDSRRMTVGFYLFNINNFKASSDVDRPGYRHAGAGICTKDGGKTWTGLDGKAWPTLMGGNSSKMPPRPVDVGGNIGATWLFGCANIFSAHLGYPVDRVFFVRTAFTGDEWWLSPQIFVTGDPRHCHEVENGDTVALLSGRVWTGWRAADRNSDEPPSSFSSYAYYSDDGGVTWCGWRGPGFTGTLPDVRGEYVRLAPYREHVALFGKNGWTRFDGAKWTPFEATGVEECWGAVSFGGEVYLAGETGPSRWYDGKEWRDFSVPGRTGRRGRMSNCGGKNLLFVEPDAEGKRLLCWRRKLGGAWQGPQELAVEDVEIVKVVVARYAPERFAPIAYMCGRKGAGKKNLTYKFPDLDPWEPTALEPWIKVLRVSAEE